MEKLEKVETIREKCGVTYEEAKAALEATEYDVLEAVIYIERMRAGEEVDTLRYATAEPEAEPAAEAPAAESVQDKGGKSSEAWDRFCSKVRKVVNGGMEMTFVAERKDERVFAVPLLFVILGLFIWGATLWLLIIGLFFGFRYHIEGASPVTVGLNGAMDKAADVAEDLKREFAN